MKTNESYLHIHAKRVLADWLHDEYERIVDEEQFCVYGSVWFIADLACYDNDGLKDIYEIVHTSDVDIWKQWRMNFYFHAHGWKGITVYRVDASWIMKQIRKPEIISFQKILS